MEDADHGLIDNWLNHLRNVRRLHAEEIENTPPHERVDKMCELNVVEQVNNVAATTVVRDAWARGQSLSLHGVVYSLADGILRELIVRDGSSSSAPLPEETPAAPAAAES